MFANVRRFGEVADFENKTSYQNIYSAILPNRCYVLGGFSAPKKYKNMKELILNKIENLCSDFLYYDRKEDEDLSYEQLKGAVLSGEITIDEMVDKFRKHLEDTLM